MRRRMGERFAKAYDVLPSRKRLAVLRYFEAYDKGGIILAEGVREEDNLCRLIEPNDRLLLSADHPYQTVFLKSSFGTFQTWWLAAAPGHPVFLQTLNAIMYDVENRGGTKAARTGMPSPPSWNVWRTRHAGPPHRPPGRHGVLAQ